jgi:hypothetical protein
VGDRRGDHGDFSWTSSEVWPRGRPVALVLSTGGVGNCASGKFAAGAGLECLSRKETFERVSESEARLRVLEKLRGFSVAAEKIVTEKGQGSFHLVVLNSADKSVSIRPYAMTRLEQANAAYAEVEKQAQSGEPVEAVLVSAGSVEALKKAYPNYFLDTHEFIVQIEKVIGEAKHPVPSGARERRHAPARRKRPNGV